MAEPRPATRAVPLRPYQAAPQYSQRQDGFSAQRRLDGRKD